MSYRLLHSLSEAKFPVNVDVDEEIDQLRAYSAAGLVVAEIPRPLPTREGLKQKEAAKVLGITTAGRKELSRQKAHPQLMGKLRRQGA